MMNWTRKSQADAIVVTVATRDALLQDLSTRMSDKAGFTIATLNLDHVVKLARDQTFQSAYARHSHITADGNPIVWLSRLAGQKDIELIPGSELIDPVAQLAAQHGIKVAFFGATEASLASASEALVARYPELDVALCLAPQMGFDPNGPEADAAIDALAASEAGLVFLAMGAPKQEIFAARAASYLPSAGFLSIGAGLDFISGSQRRAPAWVRAVAAEWLWRLIGNPRRLAARYGACLLALPGLTISALAARKRGAAK